VFFRMAKRLPGGYELLRWEDNVTHYITAPGKDVNGCGAIEGTVTEIGWNFRYIVARRKSCSGGSEGWMVIDTHTRRVTGPMTEAALRKVDDVKNIPLHGAAIAWSDELPCFAVYNNTWAPWFRGCVDPWEDRGL
jgi:hypothetical protein